MKHNLSEQSRAEQSRAEQSRDLHVDLLKIIATVAVIGLHTLQRNLSVVNATLYYLCGFAIPIFMMASGAFVMNRGKIKVKYVFRRIMKILKVVIGWNLIFFIAMYCLRNLINLELEFSIISLLEEIVLCLIQKGTLSHFWYFGALIILYCFLPLVTKSDRRKKILLLSSVILAIFMQLCSTFLGFPVQKYIWQTFRLWTWFLYYITGGLVYNIVSKKKQEWSGCCIKEKRKSFLLSVVLLTITILILHNIVGRFIIVENAGTISIHAEYFYDDLLTMIWAIAIFTYVLLVDLNSVLRHLIVFLSPLTLGVYIVQSILAVLYSSYFDIQSILESLLLFFATLLISFMVSWIINRVPVINRLVKL